MRPVARALAASALLVTIQSQSPPPPSSDGDCQLEEIEDEINNVNAACCVPASACQNGAPAQCNSQCAHVFLLFYNRCFADMSALVHDQVNVFDELAVKCQTVAPKHSCLSAEHQAQVQQNLECLASAPTQVARATCAQRTRGILGLQGIQTIRGPEYCGSFELVLPLLADVNDDSSNHRKAFTHGDAYVADGGHFDGSGDYISLPTFDYTTDGRFAMGMWFTKESCTGGIYEYLFSHAAFSPAVDRPDSFSMPMDKRPCCRTGSCSLCGPSERGGQPNPNLHMYLGCQASGGGWSSLGGTIVRFNYWDDDVN